MTNPAEDIPQEVTRRLAECVERLLGSVGGTATVSFREARDAETLRALPGPLVALACRFTRGATGPGALILPGAFALGVAKLLAGEAMDTAAAAPGPDDEDALRELANQLASGVATALGESLGQPVGFEGPGMQWLEAGGSGLPAETDGTALTLSVTLSGTGGEAWLVVPRAAVSRVPPRTAAQATLPPLRESPSRKNGNGMELLFDIALPVTVELGRTRMMIRDILHLAPGSVLELDKLAGEPVDILINEKSIARGEVVVIDENFGVRLTSIVTPSERVASLQ
jgi:flagellar motor switch protein FliN